MKRTVVLAMSFLMLLVSIGGCWPWWYEDGRGRRGEGHERGHERYEERR